MSWTRIAELLCEHPDAQSEERAGRAFGRDEEGA